MTVVILALLCGIIVGVVVGQQRKSVLLEQFHAACHELDLVSEPDGWTGRTHGVQVKAAWAAHWIGRKYGHSTSYRAILEPPLDAGLLVYARVSSLDGGPQSVIELWRERDRPLPPRFVSNYAPLDQRVTMFAQHVGKARAALLPAADTIVALVTEHAAEPSFDLRIDDAGVEVHLSPFHHTKEQVKAGLAIAGRLASALRRAS